MATPSAALGAGTPELPGHPSLDLLVDLVRRRTDRVHDRRGDLVPEGSAVNRQQNVAVRYFVIPRLEVHVLDLPQRRRKASNQNRSSFGMKPLAGIKSSRRGDQKHEIRGNKRRGKSTDNKPPPGIQHKRVPGVRVWPGLTFSYSFLGDAPGGRPNGSGNDRMTCSTSVTYGIG